VEKRDILLKTAKTKGAVIQLNKWKNLKEPKNVQLGVSHSIIIIYTKCIKMQSIAQAISYKNQS